MSVRESLSVVGTKIIKVHSGMDFMSVKEWNSEILIFSNCCQVASCCGFYIHTNVHHVSYEKLLHYFILGKFLEKFLISLEFSWKTLQGSFQHADKIYRLVFVWKQEKTNTFVVGKSCTSCHLSKSTQNLFSTIKSTNNKILHFGAILSNAYISEWMQIPEIHIFHVDKSS